MAPAKLNAWLLLVGCSAVLVLAYPRFGRSAVRPLPAQVLQAPSPQRKALTGAVAVLLTPASPLVLVTRASFAMGAGQVDIQFALEACKKETLGARCAFELFSNELAEHLVTVSSFWLQRQEVTVQDYDQCVRAGACAALPTGSPPVTTATARLPVSLVRWNDAQTYCRFVGMRLPTEAEWERAARGPTGRRFPWGNQLASRRANHGSWSLNPTDPSDGYEELAPVGSYPDGRTPDGLDDLAGNVAEWTADNYEDGYEALAVTDPQGPTFSGFKVVRGGSCALGMAWLRGSARGFRPPASRERYVGFRCASSTRPAGF